MIYQFLIHKVIVIGNYSFEKLQSSLCQVLSTLEAFGKSNLFINLSGLLTRALYSKIIKSATLVQMSLIRVTKIGIGARSWAWSDGGCMPSIWIDNHGFIVESACNKVNKSVLGLRRFSYNSLIFDGILEDSLLPLILGMLKEPIEHCECAEHEGNKEKHNLKSNISLLFDICHFRWDVCDGIWLWASLLIRFNKTIDFYIRQMLSGTNICIFFDNLDVLTIFGATRRSNVTCLRVHFPFKDRPTFLIDLICVYINHVVSSVEMKSDVRNVK